MREHAADRPLEDTITEHHRKEPTSRRVTGDPSNPLGWFWRPEEAHRDEDFRNLVVPELAEDADHRPGAGDRVH
jgi:hypothetical protein